MQKWGMVRESVYANVKGESNCSIKQIMFDIMRENEHEKPIQFMGMNNYQNNGFSITLKYITSNNFRKLYQLLGSYCIKFFVKDCILIQRQKDIFIQLSGDSLANLLNNSKAIAMQIKSNIRKENHKNMKHNLMDLNSYFNRNNILYCLHSNGKPGLFRKCLIMRVYSFLNKKIKEESRFNVEEYTDERVIEIMNKMDTNYKKSNQYNCSKGNKKEEKRIPNQSKGNDPGIDKDRFNQPNNLKIKKQFIKKRNFNFDKKNNKSNKAIQIENPSPVKSVNKKQEIFSVGGKILIEYIFRENKSNINKKTLEYFQSTFSRFAKKLCNIRFEKIFYHYCSNKKKFEYSVIKNGYSKLKKIKDLENLKNKLKIDSKFKNKERKYFKKKKIKKENQKSIIKDLESQDTAEKVIACMLDSLNKMYIEDKQIYRFIKEIISKLFPVSFFGKSNSLVLDKYIRKMVTIKRFESFCIQDIIDDLDMFQLNFYKRTFNKFYSRQIRYEKVLLIRPILKFIFDDLIMNLLKFNFYITEKHSTHNQLFFYPKDVWYLISSIGMFELCMQNCAKMDLSKTSKEQLLSIPVGKLRFVPKRNSLRPLMTFFKKFMNKKSSRMERIAKYLQPVKIVLRSVKKILSGKDQKLTNLKKPKDSVFSTITKFSTNILNFWKNGERKENLNCTWLQWISGNATIVSISKS
jgi:hypothetical protein